ncbi:MAG: phospho-sugar mutase [Clostridia bacterium]|nr:phospho-sugar mutase [Clostridia bacterium]
MINDCINKYNFWIKYATDEDVLASLKQMGGNEKEIEDAFYRDLEFGTAGLRGIMGAGTNRMNIYTIIQTARAMGEYLNSVSENVGGCNSEKKIVITYDSRINSLKFAQITACVFADLGIKAYITKGCKPTPYLSFMVRELKCDMGVNVTCSHNPKEYNGFKVYENQGCQIGEDIANAILNIKDKINPFEIKVGNFDDYLNSGKIEYVDLASEDKYLQMVLNESLCIEENDAKNSNLKVVYTALNGVGESFVTRILNRIGFDDIIYVKEQIQPNGYFETCPYPNPEKIEALKLALEYARNNDADLIIATDPDSDRMGAVVKDNKTQEYVHLSGNEVGFLLCDYILRTRKEQGTLKFEPIVIRSIVTNPLVDEIVKAYGGKVIECLTGFKNIGGEIRKLELKGEDNKIAFSYEESCGYLKGTFERDKDGVSACMLICELARKLKKDNKTLIDRLNEIKQTYGAYLSKTISIRFEGASGEKVKNQILANLHTLPPKQLGGQKVVKVIDFLTQKILDIPQADVIKLILNEDDEVLIRPSGTEPLIKCYITIKNGEREEKLNKILEDINKILSI